jgi:glycosyltransferase involved in cell wall biosynthesis
MRVAHYSAALVAQSAARRLELALRNEGMEAYSLVRSGAHDDIRQLPQNKWSRLIRSVGKRLEKKRLQWYGLPLEALWTSSFLGVPADSVQLWGSPDILHLHWIADGALDLASVARSNIPVVWTMHDTWPFTGGCHILDGCEKYQERCIHCPCFSVQRGRGYVARQFALKQKAYQAIGITVVSPSRSYLEKAKRSALLHSADVRHIPNCIDTALFRPIDKILAKQVLQLPETETIIMFGAVSVTDRHKGIDLALDALQRVAASTDGTSFTCVSFGGGRLPEDLPFPVISLGRLSDQISLVLAYSAADMFVCPSRQDNLPNTVLESLACGTPVVGFAVGGIPDMVEHGVNGYLATPEEPEDLARGISLLLGDTNLRQRMSAAGREKVEREFSFPTIARKHIALYEDILEKRLKQARNN